RAGENSWKEKPLLISFSSLRLCASAVNQGWLSKPIPRESSSTRRRSGRSWSSDATSATAPVRRSLKAASISIRATGSYRGATPEQVDEFVADRPPDALEKVVDRLLSSRPFGERWGRHWLDVVRFAESLTLRGFIMKEAWRYRDYVIDAFNRDLPYDRFVREQVAGDLLKSDSVEERRRRLVAGSFLILGNSNLEEQDKKQLEMDVVDEQLDTLGRAFLAQTIGCARCHDHKFDPIPTRDYYALAGILKNARTLEHANVSKWLEVPLPADPARESTLAKQEAAVAALQARLKAEKDKTPAAKL